MSLDVYLYERIKCPHCHGELDGEEELYSANITHNLGRMAEAAGIYKELWRPDEIGVVTASDLVKPLIWGLKRLRENPELYKTFESPNGWGLYANFVPFVENYLRACVENPDAGVRVSR